MLQTNVSAKMHENKRTLYSFKQFPGGDTMDSRFTEEEMRKDEGMNGEDG